MYTAIMAIGKPLTVPKNKMFVGHKPSIKTLVAQGAAAIPPTFAPRKDVNTIQWTPERKALVFNMLKHGIPIEDVAVTVGCSVGTLRFYCKHEIKHARIYANNKVAEVFYKMATSGKVPAATMHWMKTRVPGFKDSIEHTGEVTHVHASSIDPTKLTIEQLKALEAIHATAATETVDVEYESADNPDTDDYQS